MEVQARLRDGLGLMVTEQPDYIKALDAARCHVERQLSKERARQIAMSRPPIFQPRAPTATSRISTPT
jgi:hypothetical protein